MTVRHILLLCPRWRQERRDLGIEGKDTRYLLTTREGATTTIEFLLRTNLLKQFAHIGETHEIRTEIEDGEHERTIGEESEGEEEIEEREEEEESF